MSEKLISEWLKKAEADLRSAVRETNVTESTNFDLICYLSQQCSEKYLKAFLVSKKTEPRRTHNLVSLLEDCLKFDSSFENIREACTLVSGADLFRYPLDNATEEEAKLTLEHSTIIREFVRTKIGIQIL